ncbi:DUF3899 domain-containing protein [Sporosarcina limicola]|uniref:Vacuolar-type H+-ATPase subunit I/STV1 n=1 Tax=Sporosarcina limicola TaxID=34101 RepID=A0A927MEL8_9BACL|nr:DUF3899 domain-containing protein [Sporosarcina limicola]MBE1553324.1 vacuolar-type H+-ATPase subunit I/STV1 [Sporosarcina limicola]
MLFKKFFIVLNVLVLIIFGYFLITHSMTIHILNNIFMFGLACFMVGGLLLLIEKGVFKAGFKHFSWFFRRSSKLNQYADEEVGSEKTAVPYTKAAISPQIVGSGLFLIALSTIFSIILM